MEAAVLRLLAHRAVDDGAPTVAAQVRGWMRSGEMVDRHGVALVNYGCDVPVLMVGAGLDLLVSAEDVQRTAERLPGAEYHHLAAFGHLDPVLGRTARQEVYPIVQAFLARFQ
jgi:pimeloyl-ACP methyl ester carboxylesterase